MDTVIGRYKGYTQTLTRPHLQHMLYKIQSDTNNIYDVYLDADDNLWYAIIADNTFLILDNDFDINAEI